MSDIRRRARGLAASAILSAVILPAGGSSAAEQPAVTIERASVTIDGAQAGDDSRAASVSPDGRFVTFESSSDNLVTGDTNRVADVFVRDRQTSATERMSVATDGTQADGDSSQPGFSRPTISADGRFVAFTSRASNLVPGDSNETVDVFVRDRQTSTTERVSVASDSAQADGASLGATSISADGRFVAFTSIASNLVADDANDAFDVFVRDRLAGVTERVSVGTSGSQADGSSLGSMSMSADGRSVAFSSDAANLVTGDSNGEVDVFLRDRRAGVTERISVASDGTQADDISSSPSITADGRFVAFQSDATNLGVDVTDTNVYLRDREAGTTEFVSPPIGSGYSRAFEPSISSDGRFVAFAAHAPVRDVTDVVRSDRQTHVAETVSVATNGGLADGTSRVPSIGDDGRFVAFESAATNLVAGDTNDRVDVFVHAVNDPPIAVDDAYATDADVTVSMPAPGVLANDSDPDGDALTASLSTGPANGKAKVDRDGGFTYAPARGFTGTDTFTYTACEPTGCTSAVVTVTVLGRDPPTDPPTDPPGTDPPGTDPTGTLTFDPASLAIPERLGGLTGPPLTVTAANAGDGPLTMTKLGLEGASPDAFAITSTTCAGVTLAPRERCSTSVTFTNQSPGRSTAALRFDGSATGAPHRIPLTGAVTEPTLDVNPGVGAQGSVTEASGAGFPPGKTVTVTWAEPVTLATAGFAEPAQTVTTAADGTFRVPLMAFPNSVTGGRVAVASVGEFTANAPFLVGLPSITIGHGELVRADRR